MSPPFTRVLVANRGEIALRVARACREMGIEVVAVYSTVDQDTPVVRMADEAVHIGPPAPKASYLHIPSIVEAALQTGADAIHPGYGFLSEDPDFAEICAKEGLIFIGPEPDVMQQLGNKATARAVMSEAGLPLLPGTVDPVQSQAEGAEIADRVGYPVIIKAVAGGGGRGMTVVHKPQEFAQAFTETTRTAQAVFRDRRTYIERYLPDARHVEIQVLCDTYGNGVHLGERDCSIQRRHQKLIEEAPSGCLAPQVRAAMSDAAIRGALAVGYSGVGTVEFLVDRNGQDFYFMEMNARIQVEHPVTEMTTGVDLIREQIRVAAGERLGITQRDVTFRGAAIECRINAEDADRGFAATPGVLDRLDMPGGPWTRVDSGYTAGSVVSPYYDSLLAKLVVWAPDREQALARMGRALGELRIDGPGVATTADFHRMILRHPEFLADTHNINFVGQLMEAPRKEGTQ